MRADPPLDPTSPEAREWLEEELRKSVYQEQPGLLDRIWDWVLELLTGTTGGPGLPAWTVAVVVVLVLAVIALVVARTLRRDRRMTGVAAPGVLDGPVRSAAEHRDDARRALAAGDADTAVVEGYRAVARATVERAVLDDLPGRTAHEVAVALAPVFPAHASGLAGAADVFDAVRYGRRPATRAQAENVLSLDGEIARTTPVLPDLVAATVVTG
ncbi:MAG: DUF4129 domain-containing protein [Dermatophilaceae bacterium]